MRIPFLMSSHILHPVTLRWLIAELLRLRLEPVLLRATQRDDVSLLLRAVNRTDCYPCLVLIDGWILQIFTREEAAARPYLFDTDGEE